MAAISTQIPANSVSLTSPSTNLITKFSSPNLNSIKFPVRKPTKSNQFYGRGIGKKSGFRLRAGIEDGFVAFAEEKKEEITEIGVLKKQLVDSFYGTNMGLSATSETRAEIVELITQLEAKNPTPEPTTALPLLNGKWILAYTSFAGLYPLLSSGTISVLKVDEISQTIDSENLTVQNCVVFAGFGSKTEFTTNATYEVRSPRRVQIKFEEGIIGTPQLTDSIEIPESVEILGQKIDLSPFKGLITSVEDTASNVAKTISSQPPLKFSISQTNAESWLLTTYLDDELRISRADGGKVFVLLKEGSLLLSS